MSNSSCELNIYNKKCGLNEELLKMEKDNYEYNGDFIDDNVNLLYPTLDDPNFNKKIAEKKEFSNTRYDGSIYDVKEYSNYLLHADYELLPQQAFIKNFLSFYTPYNSALLYHGLGSGKTCTGIGVCEEMRDYLIQMGIKKKIIILASSNVQDNFKLALFDERELKNVDGLWTIHGCVANKLLKEVNPTNIKNIEKDKIVRMIKTLINEYYEFHGYREFSNIIKEIVENPNDTNAVRVKKLQNTFKDTLILIDEVHNIRVTDDNTSKTQGKEIAKYLLLLASVSINLRFVLLSATPMFNNYKEIIWLINLMNMNDKRGVISVSDVFDNHGNFTTNGKALFIRKCTGYISYIRGDNPYTFPFRVYPSTFAPQQSILKNNKLQPHLQINGEPLSSTISKLDLFAVSMGPYQKSVYNIITNNLLKQGHTNFNYSDLLLPINALNIVYPYDNIDSTDFAKEDLQIQNNDNMDINEDNDNDNVDVDDVDNVDVDDVDDNDSYKGGAKFVGDLRDLVGLQGLKRTMKFQDTKTPYFKGNYEYKPNKPPIFQPDLIGQYSSKIKTICDFITNSDGIILIYSQFIDSGLIPLVLALEELGFNRYSQTMTNLFSKTTRITNNLPFKYSLITSDKRLSPNNDYEIKALTDKNNINGEKVKVVLISQAGSEGIDLKGVRAVFIMEPWFNISRLEQIIGRGVRNGSHKLLDFEYRNVQIFMLVTVNGGESNEESVDYYIYRIAEVKAINMGKIQRVLKQVSVDYYINHEQTNLTAKNFEEYYKTHNLPPITQVLADKQVLTNFVVGDLDNTVACDFMECEYDGINTEYEYNPKEDKTIDTYMYDFMLIGSEVIKKHIREFMKMRHYYDKKELLQLLNNKKKYSIEQIYAALTDMIDNKDVIIDKYERTGYLVNKDNYYLFQPIELTDTQLSTFERSVPLDVKRTAVKVVFDIEAEKQKRNKQGTHEYIFMEMVDNYKLALNSNKIIRGNDNWYIHCGCIMREPSFKQHYDIFENFLIQHIVDSLTNDNKISLLNYYYSGVTGTMGTTGTEDAYSKRFYTKSKEYLMSKVIVKGDSGIQGFILFDGPSYISNIIIYVLNQSNVWELAQSEDVYDLMPIIKKKFTVKDKNMYSHYIGFIGYDGIYKIKDTHNKRSTGFRCSQANKNNIIAVFENGDLNTELISYDISNDNSFTLCVRHELLVRFLQYKRYLNKIWFMSTEMAIFNEFEKKESVL